MRNLEEYQVIVRRSNKSRVMNEIWILVGLAVHAIIFVLGIAYLANVIKKNDKDKWFDL
jgi:biotin transporter BioY